MRKTHPSRCRLIMRNIALKNAARPSLKNLLMSDVGRTDFDLPQRGLGKRRKGMLRMFF